MTAPEEKGGLAPGRHGPGDGGGRGRVPGAPRPDPTGPPPGLQSGSGQRGGLGMDGVCPAAEGTGCGVGGRPTNPPPGGPQGEDHQGACVTLLTPPCPQRRPRLPGALGRPQLAPPLPQRADGAGAAAAGDASPGGGNGGPPEKGDVCGILHTVGPGASRSAWAGPWRAKNGHPLPHRGRKAGLSSPSLGGTPAPPQGDRLGGAATTPTPDSCSGAADGGGRTPRTQFQPPQPTNARFRGVRRKNGPEGARDGAEAFTVRDPAQDQSGCGRTHDDSPTSGAHETPATQGASLPTVLQAPASCPLPAADCPQVPPALDPACLPQRARPIEDPPPLPSPWASWVGSRPPVH